MLERFKQYADIYTNIDQQKGFLPDALKVMRRWHVLGLNSLVPVFMEMVLKLRTGKELNEVVPVFWTGC